MNHTKVRIDKQVVFNAQSTTQKLGQTDKWSLTPSQPYKS